MAAAAGSGGDGGTTGGDITIELSPSPLSVERAFACVVSPAAGGTAMFVGTTRDTFHGRPVVRLEYEAYEALALTQLRTIAADAMAVTGSASSPCDRLVRVYVAHRVGVVPVGEASVIVAASSVHRGRAFDAVPAMMHALKATVAIWKREVYGDGDGDGGRASSSGDAGDAAAATAAAAVWKVNRECLEARTAGVAAVAMPGPGAAGAGFVAGGTAGMAGASPL